MIPIVLQGIEKFYQRGEAAEVHALRNVNLEFETGISYAIVGASGAGKTTLLSIMGCLDVPSEGNYTLDGTPIGSLSENKRSDLRLHKIGFVLQEFGLVEEATVHENVMAPLIFAKIRYKEAKQRAKEVLRQFKIEGLGNKWVSQLSGGQRQRVAIARAIVNKPTLLLCDEPTGALDSQTADEVMDALFSVKQSDAILIIVTHNPAVAQRCERIITLKDGAVV